MTDAKKTKSATGDQLNSMEVAGPSAEGTATLREKLYEDVTKPITVETLQQDVRAKLSSAIEALRELKEEIAYKKQGALDKREMIRGKVVALCDAGKISIDKSEFEKSDLSVQEFVGLLDRMIEEVEADRAFYESLLSQNPPATMTVFKVETGPFNEVISNRINNIKRYVKAAKRDLSVSYSRYCFGFETQLRQVLFVEQVLARKA